MVERRDHGSTSQVLFKENSILKKSVQGGGKEWDEWQVQCREEEASGREEGGVGGQGVGSGGR